MDKDFEHRPNSQVEYRSPEEMKKYLRDMLFKYVQMIEIKVTKKLIIRPGDGFPFDINVNADKAVSMLEKLTALLTNTTTQVLLVGFLEELDLFQKTDERNEFFKLKIENYQKFLSDVTQNIAILQKELGD